MYIWCIVCEYIYISCTFIWTTTLCSFHFIYLFIHFLRLFVGFRCFVLIFFRLFFRSYAFYYVRSFGAHCFLYHAYSWHMQHACTLMVIELYVDNSIRQSSNNSELTKNCTLFDGDLFSLLVFAVCVCVCVYREHNVWNIQSHREACTDVSHEK